MALRTISVCSGIGALDLGFHRAFPDAVTACYVEREIYPAEVLAARMEDGWLDLAPVWSDLATFDGAAWRGSVDCLIGGIPCQPFSVAGKRQGTDDERWIWADVLRIIREAGPSIVALENVPGFVRHGLPVVLGDLAQLGFDAAWRVVSAADVGAPHIRKRFFLLAYRDMADARHGLVPLAGRGPEGRAGAGSAGANMDDTEGTRLATGTIPVRTEAAYPRPEHAGVHVGHADELDDHRCWYARSGRWRKLADPGFPPAPDDRAGWSAVLSERPDLAPATQPGLYRLADESGPRLDRLRAAGNAVVVRQATAAFAKLREDLGV